MMESQNNVDVQQISFEQLTPCDNLQSSGALIGQYIKGHSWNDSFNCITELRKINKYHTEFVPSIVENYSQTILELLNTGKTLLVKNIFRFIKQLFDAGQQVNVEKAVYAFLPVLIKKASTETIGYMKNSAQQVLTSFTCNCGYEASFLIAAQNCCDKNASVAELSIKLLSALVQKVGPGVMQLSENTLSALMGCLSNLINGKRQNLCNSALDICIFICESIGSQNYLKLMQFCLSQGDVQSMGNSMQNHRVNKQKPQRLKQALKSRKTQAFNANFFNSSNNNNFVPLGQKQMNYSNGNNNYNNNDYYNNQNNNSVNNNYGNGNMGYF